MHARGRPRRKHFPVKKTVSRGVGHSPPCKENGVALALDVIVGAHGKGSSLAGVIGVPIVSMASQTMLMHLGMCSECSETAFPSTATATEHRCRKLRHQFACTCSRVLDFKMHFSQ